MILLSLFISFFHPAFADEVSNDEVTSIERRLNRSAYKDATLLKRYDAIQPGDQAKIDAVRKEVVDVIRLNERAWFSAVAPGNSLPSETRNTIMKAIETLDVWVCKGKSCSDCGTENPNGCVRSRSTVGSVGSIAIIHPCLFTSGGCVKAPANLLTWMETVAGSVAYTKITRNFKQESARVSGLVSSRMIRQTSKSVNELLGSCPGPYSDEAFKFLAQTGHVSEPNPSIKRCGDRYVDLLKTLSKKCPEMGLFSTPLAEFSARYLNGPVRVSRCDSFCQVMTCNKRNRYPPLVKFGTRSALLLVDGACEGETLTRVTDFLRATLPPEIGSSSAMATCLAKLDPRPTRDSSSDEWKPSKDGTILPDGPDIPLIQN